MIVKRNKASITKICGVYFYPGNNVIDKEKENELMSNGVFNSLLVTKIQGQSIHEIVVHNERTDTENVLDKPVSGKSDTKNGVQSDLQSLNAKDAIEIVKDTLSIPALEKMAENESRTSVIKAIDLQIESIKKVDKDE